MKKSDLKQGMLVQTTGGNIGVVVIKDGTDENCIKFAYCDKLLVDHGFQNRIDSLDEYDENLNCYRIVKEGDCWNKDGYPVGKKLIFYQIIRVFDLKLIAERANLEPESLGLSGSDDTWNDMSEPTGDYTQKTNIEHKLNLR